MNKEKMIQKGSLFLLECFHDAMTRYSEEEIALAVAQQKEDVCCSIAAFFELKIPENTIMHLLSVFYNVDSIAEASELITKVKANKLCSALSDYLNELGMSHIDVIKYMKNHSVIKQISKDSKLQNMPVDKLKAYFDKHWY